MGVLTKYFTIDDGLTHAIVHSGPDRLVPEEDVLPATGVDPTVMLGRLGEQLTGVDFLEIGRTERCGGGREHGVERLGDMMRDTLAAIEEDDVPAIAARWATIEEMHAGVTGPDVEGFVRDISALARRAAQTGRHLYCWWSL